jgi:hypothetical protein
MAISNGARKRTCIEYKIVSTGKRQSLSEVDDRWNQIKMFQSVASSRGGSGMAEEERKVSSTL